VTGGWRKLHNEELHNLYSSPSIIRMIKSRKMRLAEHVARNWGNTNAYRILVVKPEGKRQLGTSRRRWVDNIKMDLREIRWDGVDWIDPSGGLLTMVNMNTVGSLGVGCGLTSSNVHSERPADTHVTLKKEATCHSEMSVDF
jgi:hypothetical protein